jgi:hypothetical protein
MSPNKITNSFFGQRSFKKFIAVLALLLLGGNGWGQLSITNLGVSYTQNFDVMGSAGVTTPANWYVGTGSTCSSTTIIAGTGSANSGGNYNFGVTGINNISDRSLGSLCSGNIIRNTQINLINNTGSSISSITISYDGEQWRLGQTSSSESGLVLNYSIDGTTFLAMGSSYNFIPPITIGTAAALDGNSNVNRITGIGGTYTFSAPIANNTSFYLRWVDLDNSGSDAASAIDNFSIIAYSPTTPTITTTGTIAAVNTTYGTASSSPTSFTVSGSNLTNNISISAPTGYEIAVGAGTYASSQTLTQTSGAVASTTINVRLAANTAAGSYSGNIALTSTGATSVNVATVSSTVSKKALTISGLTATNKNWDGTTSATVNGIGSEAYSGLVLSETFSIVTSGSISFVFSSANAGTAIPLTQTNTYSAPTTNYSITQPTLSANITAIAPSAPIITSITPGSGQLSVSFTAPTSTGGSTITNYEYSSNNGSTWTLRNPSSTSTPLLLNGLTNGTTYDVQIRAVNSIGSGTASAGMQGTPVSQATLTLSSNTFSSSFSTVYGTASSSQSFTLNGADLAGNITITPTTGFEISQTSGGTTGFATSQTITPSSGTISSTILYVRLAATASVGNYNTQNISASGGGATTQIIASSASGNIVSPKALTISGLSAANKVYDATTTVSITANPVYVGLANGESFSVSGNPTWAFTNKTVGTAKAITQTGLYSAPSSNYTVSQASLTADITLASLSISNLTVNTKSYDGTTTATLSGGTLVGLFSGDLVSIGSSTGVFTTANVGAGISVTANSVLTGTDASNYVLIQATGLTGTITIATQTLSFTTFTSPISASTTIVASSNCNGSITYTSSNTAVATINSSTGVVSVVGLGTTTITAATTATSNYSAATISQTLTVTAPSLNLVDWEVSTLSAYGPSPFSPTQNSNLYTSGLLRGSGISTTPTAALGLWGGNGLNLTDLTSAIAGNDFITFSLNPNAGYIMSLSEIPAHNIRRTGTGAAYGLWQYSMDGTTFNDIGSTLNWGITTSSGNVQNPISLTSISALQNVTNNTTITFRLVIWGASAPGGNWYINNNTSGYDLSVIGTINLLNTTSAASSAPTLCINTALTNITHSTTGATGIGTATGLPAGVTASWTNNTITISGTPTASGTFSYSIPLTGGCGTVNATGTITVNADKTVSAASSSPSLCMNTALTAITHTTNGATGIGTATGLPAGVTAAWANNTLTISGTPTASGNFSYTIPLTGGCGSVNATGTITVLTSPTANAGADITGVTTCAKNTVPLNATALNNNESGAWTVVTLGTGATLPGSFTLSNTPSGDFSGSYGGTYTLAWTVTNTTTNCSNADNMVVSFNQPNISSLGSSIGDTDFLWNGLTSTDGATGSNWYQNVSGFYQLQTGSFTPNNTSQIFMLTTSQAGICVGTNLPTIATGTENVLDLYVGSGMTLNLGSGTLNISGDLVNNGTINSSVGTVNFNGTSNATFSGTGLTRLNNATINKTNGSKITLTNDLVVKGQLNMIQGNIITASLPYGLLTLGTSSAVPGTLSWTSGNIVGPFRRFFTTTATQGNEGLFPVGTATYQRYAKVNFTASPGTDQTLTAWYKTGAPATNGATLYNGLPLSMAGATIQNYSADGYWQIDPTGDDYSEAINSANYTIELYANNLSGMQDPTICRIIKAPGSNTSSSSHVQWQACGTPTPIATGTSPSAFTINSTAVQGFSWFSVGTSGNQALPVELTSFSGNCADGKVILDWSTATEHNSAYFQVENSRDGKIWQNIGVVAAAGNSVQNINYTLTHEQLASGNNYYRLRQVDIDGVEKLYDVIAVTCAAGSDPYIMSYPNPSEQNFQVEVLDENLIGTATLSMVDARGMLIHSELLEVKAGTYLFLFNNTGLAPGIYYVKISRGAYSSEVVKQVVR